MLPRPRFRLPLWAPFALAGGAYVVRSAVRGFQFRPDLPMDAIVFVLLIAVVVMVRWQRGDDTRPDE